MFFLDDVAHRQGLARGREAVFHAPVHPFGHIARHLVQQNAFRVAALLDLRLFFRCGHRVGKGRCDLFFKRFKPGQFLAQFIAFRITPGGIQKWQANGGNLRLDRLFLDIFFAVFFLGCIQLACQPCDDMGRVISQLGLLQLLLFGEVCLCGQLHRGVACACSSADRRDLSGFAPMIVERRAFFSGKFCGNSLPGRCTGHRACRQIGWGGA